MTTRNNKVYVVIKRRDIGYLATAVEVYAEMILSENGKEHGKKLLSVLEHAHNIALRNRSIEEDVYTSGEWTEDKAQTQIESNRLHKLKRYSRLLLQCLENLEDGTVFAKENDKITLGDIREFVNGSKKSGPLKAMDCLDRFDSIPKDELGSGAY